MNKISKIVCFVIFSALLTSGFPNFMMQEAHAVTGYTAQTTSTTQITITWDVTNMDSVSITDTDFEITLDDSTVITSANFNVAFSDGTGAGGNDQTIITLTANTMPTDDTPDVELLIGQSVTSGGSVVTLNGVQNVEATDGVSPVVSSASVTSSTTITITFSEDIVDTASDLSDYTINGAAGGSDISAKSVSGSVLTLTTNGYEIQSGETITVSFDGDANELEDTGTLNDVADFTNQTVTNGLTSDGGGSGCKDCEEPTLGVLSSGKRIVDDGFTYNGHSVDVERFFTPYPLITAQTGKQNTAVFKIYENRGPNNIAHFDFAFGLGKDQIISDSKAMIEVDFARDGTQTVNIVDPENALDNVSVTTDTVSCSEGPTQCLEITIKHTFRESLDFDIVGTNVWDHSRQSWQNYYNHGIEVVGPSLNPAKQHDGVNQGHIYHLTEISKTTAVDEFGNAWTFQYGKWSKDFIKQERIQDGQKLVFDRMHSDFADYKENLANEAFSQLAEMCPLCIEEYADFDVATSLEYGNKISKLTNPEIQKIMNLENKKAQEILKYIMDPKLSSSEKYHASIEKDERPISEILAEERMLSQYLQDEHYWLKQIIAPHN